MNPLPNLFLADLGPDLILTPHTVREACLTVRRNRDLWLARLRTRQIAEIIAYSAEQWFEPGNGFRARALADQLADGPPLVFAAIKDITRETAHLPVQQAFDMVTKRKLKTVDILYSSEDQLEGARAFAEKRKPQWKGK